MLLLDCANDMVVRARLYTITAAVLSLSLCVRVCWSAGMWLPWHSAIDRNDVRMSTDLPLPSTSLFLVVVVS